MQASMYFSGTARYGVNNRAALLGLAVTVPLCLWLVPHQGMVGAALGMSASYTASVAYLFWHYRQATGAQWHDLLPGPKDIEWVVVRLAKSRTG
jgi:O-antigen/teichoic acid export membrane protein